MSVVSQLSSGPRYQYWAELAGLHLVPTKMPKKKRDFCGGALGPNTDILQTGLFQMDCGLGHVLAISSKVFSSKSALRP
jgi:hypothetical protein